MMIDILLGFFGIILSYAAIRILGKTKLTQNQRLMIYSLGTLTFIFYIIFGLLDFSTEAGSELNLGLFQISYGISESILIFLILVLPIVFGILLIITLKKFSWIKRFFIPILLVASIVMINFFQTYREFKQHQWDFEQGMYDKCLSLNCGELLQ